MMLNFGHSRTKMKVFIFDCHHHQPLSEISVLLKLSLTSSTHWFNAPLARNSSVMLPQQQQ